MNVIRNNLLFLSLLVLSVSCATFYVSPNGNDSNSGTSQSTPFKTIQKAVSTAGTNPIVLMTGTYSGTGNAGIEIYKNLTISAQPGVTVSCAGTTGDYAFYITWYSTKDSFSGFTIQDCKSAIYFYQSTTVPRLVNIDSMHFTNAETAIFDQNSLITITNSKFTNLKVGITTYGFNNGLNIDNCSFYNMTTHAIYAESCYGVANITNSVFVSGGSSAITTNTCHMAIVNSTFAFNNAFYSGSCLLANQSSEILIDQSTFISNEAYYGGAIFVAPEVVLTINNSVFTNNTGQDGGVIHTAGTVNIFNSAFNSNSGNFGGAYYCSAGEMILGNVLFSNNVGRFGETSYCNNCLIFGSKVTIVGDSGPSCLIHYIPTSDLLALPNCVSCPK